MKRIASYSRILLVAVVAISIPASVAIHAQGNRDIGYHGHIGIIAGFNYNTLGSDVGRFIQLPGTHENLWQSYPTATGTAPYAALFAEYMGEGSLGLQLRASFDQRRVTAENSSSELKITMSYGSLEAGIRWNTPFDNLYIIGGPSIAIPIDCRYDATWRKGSNHIEDVEMQQVRYATFGFWGGAGYDLPLYLGSHTQWYITPFIEGSYMTDQKGPDIIGSVINEDWNTFTVRGGIQLKFGLTPNPYITERFEPALIPDSPLDLMR